MDTLTLDKSDVKDNSTEGYKFEVFSKELAHPETSNDKAEPVEDYIKNVASAKQESIEEGTDKQFDPSKIKRTIELDYEYKGERFELHLKNGKVYLNHPEWSLVGMGDTLLDAELDMINEAKIIAEEYINVPDTKLSRGAQNLKMYLLKIV